MSNLFLRHGEVQNIKNIMYGDIPGYRLSENGVSQAISAGEYIKNNFDINRIITSPVLRARETSKHVASFLEVEIQISHNLYEWSGVRGWTGTTFNEFSQTEDYQTYQQNPIDILNTNEKLDKVHERVNSLYESVENTLFVSHQDTIRAFTFYKTEAKNFNDEKPIHCGIQQIIDGKLMTYNY